MTFNFSSFFPCKTFLIVTYVFNTISYFIYDFLFAYIWASDFSSRD